MEMLAAQNNSRLESLIGPTDYLNSLPEIPLTDRGQMFFCQNLHVVHIDNAQNLRPYYTFKNMGQRPSGPERFQHVVPLPTCSPDSECLGHRASARGGWPSSSRSCPCRDPARWGSLARGRGYFNLSQDNHYYN